MSICQQCGRCHRDPPQRVHPGWLQLWQAAIRGPAWTKSGDGMSGHASLGPAELIDEWLADTVASVVRLSLFGRGRGAVTRGACHGRVADQVRSGCPRLASQLHGAGQHLVHQSSPFEFGVRIAVTRRTSSRPDCQPRSRAAAMAGRIVDAPSTCTRDGGTTRISHPRASHCRARCIERDSPTISRSHDGRR